MSRAKKRKRQVAAERRRHAENARRAAHARQTAQRRPTPGALQRTESPAREATAQQRTARLLKQMAEIEHHGIGHTMSDTSVVEIAALFAGIAGTDVRNTAK